MSYTEVKTVVTGSRWSATDWNNYIRDNFAAGVPDIFTAKSDLAIATGVNAATRLAVGSTGKVLTVDHSTTTGIKWALPPESDIITTKGDLLVGLVADSIVRLPVGTNNYILCSEYKLPYGVRWDLICSHDMLRKVSESTNFNGQTEKIAGSISAANGDDQEHKIFDYDTNKRFDISRSGYYLVALFRQYVTVTALSANDQLRTMIYNNGNLVSILGMNVGQSTEDVYLAHIGFDIIYADANDYLDFYWYQNTGADVNYDSECRYYVVYLGS